jgi:hypothetical protein
MIPFNICICFKFQSTALSGPNPNYLCFIKIKKKQMEKSDIIFKASFNEFSSSARDNVESSAYWLTQWLIRNSELLILIPLIFGLNFNAALSSSTANINREFIK